MGEGEIGLVGRGRGQHSSWIGWLAERPRIQHNCTKIGCRNLLYKRNVPKKCANIDQNSILGAATFLVYKANSAKLGRSTFSLYK